MGVRECPLDFFTSNPGYCFVLDNRPIVTEDYFEFYQMNCWTFLEFNCGPRLALGPWYAYPGALLPGGETHIGNLL